MSTKTCTKCGETKPLDEFGKCARNKSGRQSWCKGCKSTHYQANRDRIRSQHREWREANPTYMSEYMKKYRAANLERMREKDRDYYWTNRDALLESSRVYYRANRDARLEASREYMKTEDARAKRAAWVDRNREQLATAKAEYHRANPHVSWRGGYLTRVSQWGMEPVVEDFTKADVIERYGDSCAYCGTGDFEHLDHAIPVSRGGPHTLENVRPSCSGCNLAKTDKTEAEWLAEQAELDDLTEDELDDLIDAEIERWTN